ncbi:MAG: [protein-PII] uridylyltransferase [Sphingomonadales bacterium]
MDNKVHKEIKPTPTLAGDIKTLALQGKPYDILRKQVVAALKPEFQNKRDDLAKRLRAQKISGLETARALSDIMDGVLRELNALAPDAVLSPETRTASEAVALVATGGYGRRQLAFYSDIDLMFLIPGKPAPWIEKVTEFMLQVLWDLGLKVGHSLRSEEDCIQIANKDLSVKTALLDARFLAGDEKLFAKMEKKFRKKIISGKGRQFVEDKLRERAFRHQRMGDSRYIVEPNLKDGKGGLRDLHTLFWLARFLYGVQDISGLTKKKLLRPDELATFKKAENFLWTVRQYIHLKSGRAEERLTFDVQLTLAEEFGYRDSPGLTKIERFMKHYFLTAKNVGDLTRIFCALLEARHQKKGLFDWASLPGKNRVEGFRLDGGRLTTPYKKNFQKYPENMVQIFAVADRHGYDIHPDALRQIANHRQLINARLRRDPAANDAFMEVLTSKRDPETGLRRMNEAGVLGLFVTDFGRAVAQTQQDMYHYYTVDEHTIRAVGLLAQIEKGGLSEAQTLGSEIAGSILSRAALYMALFLHDIAKGRGGDHSELGEGIARTLCPRVGFTPAETDLVAWLVRDHLLMSNVAFKRDISDPETLKTFTRQVGTLERLRLLTVLTIADIMAVGPNIWTAWKHRLLTDLYQASKPWFTRESSKEARVTQSKEKKTALNKALKKRKVKGIKALVNLFPGNYWLADRAPVQVKETLLVKRQSAGKIAIDISPQEGSDIYRISAVAPAGPEFFPNMAGGLASFGINILDARGYTLKDGRRLNSFVVDNPVSDLFSSKEKKKELVARLKRLSVDVLQTFKIPSQRNLIEDRKGGFKIPSRVRFNNEISSNFTVLEVQGRDKIGFLYQLTRILVRHGCAIFSAHVATYGARAVDVFYIQDRDGNKILDAGQLEKIKNALNKHLGVKIDPGKET